jgi:hypothetical protein
MAIAQQSPRFSQVLELPQSQEVQVSGERVLLKLALLPQRLGWHLKAYVPILGIMVLVLASLVFLQLHWLTQQWLRWSGNAR